MNAVPELDAAATALHHRSHVFDALSLRYVLEPEYSARMRTGGVGITVVTVAMGEESWDETLELIERSHREVEANPDLMLVCDADDLARARDSDKIGVVFGFQGTSMIGPHLWRVGLLRRLGVRVLQLTYTGANLYGDGCGETRDAGVSMLGREFIDAVNEENLVLDLSHCGFATTLEGTELAAMPVITHANCHELTPNGRNKTDEMLRAVAAKDGVVAMCCLPPAVKAEGGTVEDVVDHIEHAVGVAGAQHVGLGLDYTEAYRDRGQVLPDSRRWRTLRPDIFGGVDDFVSRSAPAGLESVADLPNLTAAMLRRDHREDLIQAVLGENWLRRFSSALSHHVAGGSR